MLPALRAFAPGLLIVSAGFDGADGDASVDMGELDGCEWPGVLSGLVVLEPTTDDAVRGTSGASGGFEPRDFVLPQRSAPSSKPESVGGDDSQPPCDPATERAVTHARASPQQAAAPVEAAGRASGEEALERPSIAVCTSRSAAGPDGWSESAA